MLRFQPFRVGNVLDGDVPSGSAGTGRPPLLMPTMLRRIGADQYEVTAAVPGYVQRER